MPLLPGRLAAAPAVVEEHRYLRRAMDELADMAIHTPPVREGGPWCAELAARLQDLSVRLERHFRGEEEPGGLYPQVLRAMPDTAEQIDGLQAQHRRLLEACRTLAEGAASTPLDGEAFYRLAAHIAAVIAELSSHEANESDLMLCAAAGAAAGPAH
jgi:iron-sulfur cluster repair protein YtfE (RIC family)